MDRMQAKKKEYAQLLIEVGLNVRKGQELLIFSPVECADFARLCMEAGYGRGARNVQVIYGDDAVTRARYLQAEEEVFDSVPFWQQHLYNDYAQEDAAMLFIAASDPKNLAGADPNRILRYSRARGEALRTFRELEMSNGFPWCIASVPILCWAEQVFPHLRGEAAMDALWDAIFAAVRVEGDGGAADRWQAHLSMLEERTKKLNAYRFCKLHYRNSLGTDLTVQLPKDHIWMSGEDRTKSGQRFVANMPTEEIFTAPLKEGVDGKIVASMPLVNGGNVIRDFYFRLEKGKIVEVSAGEGEVHLKNAVSVDEGASFFGEVALIPYDSPICKQKLLYYETLFDENASCHFAFGEAYPCIEGGDRMSAEERAAHGLNQSTTHVDFMVGTADLSIVGEQADGTRISVFEQGNFAI